MRPIIAALAGAATCVCRACRSWDCAHNAQSWSTTAHANCFLSMMFIPRNQRCAFEGNSEISRAQIVLVWDDRNIEPGRYAKKRIRTRLQRVPGLPQEKN